MIALPPCFPYLGKFDGSRVLTGERRSIAAKGKTALQNRQITDQQYHHTTRFQQPGILLINQRPPAGSHYVPVRSSDLEHHLALKGPEVLPTVLCHNSSNTTPGEIFDACIGIDERKIESLCQHFAHTAFASTTQTGQDDIHRSHLLHVNPNALEVIPEAWIGFRHTPWLLNPDTWEPCPSHTKTHRHAVIVVGRDLCAMQHLGMAIDLQTIREFGHLHPEFAEFSGEGPQAIGFLQPQIGHVRDTRFALTERSQYGYSHSGIGQGIEVNGSKGPKLCRPCYLQALSA